jgi:cellulose biosynthesis protein BcsQ
MIAIWGARGAGKTTFTAHLAKELGRHKKIYVLGSNLVSPSVSLYFTSGDSSKSIYKAFRDPEQVEENTIKDKKSKAHIIDSNTSDSSLMAGFTSDNQVDNLLKKLEKSSEILLVDCNSDHSNIITKQVLLKSSMIYFLIKPELESFAFYLTNIALINKINLDNNIRYILNMSTKQLSHKLIEEELKIKFSYIIKSNKRIKENSLRGQITSRNKSRKFYKTLRAIAQEIEADLGGASSE